MSDPGKSWQIIQGDAREVLAGMDDQSVHCVVTSPPYFGLRSYGTPPLLWGGPDECEHEWDGEYRPAESKARGERPELTGGGATSWSTRDGTTDNAKGQFCRLCGCWKGSLGLEPDPWLYCQHLVDIFRAVRRVLRDDGTLWLNIAGCYAGSWGNYHPTGTGGQRPKSTERYERRAYASRDFLPPTANASSFKPKDWLPIPWMLGMALQEPYYTGRIKAEKDRAWLAALVDADGCFGIRRQRNSGNRNPAWKDSFIPYLSIKMSDREPLDHAVAITGYGRVRAEPEKVGTDNRKIRTNRIPYKWRLDGNKAVQMAKELYPDLIVKKPQAACLYTLDLSNKAKRRGKGNVVPESVIAFRREIWEYVKALNQRQTDSTPNWLESPPSLYEPGWWLRSPIIWAKGLSFCEEYSGSVMPESVTDRPTTSYEYVLLLTKSKTYYYDQDAVREVLRYPDRTYGPAAGHKTALLSQQGNRTTGGLHDGRETYANPAGRNLRSVWAINPHPFADAHFATFPPALVEPCIKAGTSERGCCPECGKPWERVVEKTAEIDESAKGSRFDIGKTAEHQHGRAQPGERFVSRTLGWRPGCDCYAKEWMHDEQAEISTEPCTVLDPFCGSGTTVMVALRLGRRAIGIDLSESYCEMARKRVIEDNPMFNRQDLGGVK